MQEQTQADKKQIFFSVRFSSFPSIFDRFYFFICDVICEQNDRDRK